MIRSCHLLFFLFVCGSSFGQSTYDSLLNEVVKAENEQKADALNELASFFQTGSPDSVNKYAHRAYLLSEKIQYRKGKVQALSFLALSKRMHSQYDSSLFYYQKALTLSDGITMPAIQAEILMGIGGVYYYQNIPDSALNNFVEAAEKFEKLGMKRRLASAYSNLGMIMNANGQDEKALFYFKEALMYAEDFNLLNVQLPVLVNLAVYYEYRNQYDSALYYADACYKISAQNNMRYGMGRALLILPSLYAHFELYDLSLSSAREGITLFKEEGNEVLHNRMIYQEAVALSGLKQYQKAATNCDFLLAQLEEGDVFNEQVYLLASEIQTKLNHPEKALQYYKSFFEAYKNSSLQQQKEQLAELETIYDTERKSREIESLNDRGKLQELRIRQQTGVIIGGLTLAIVTIVLILLFYRQRELKRKNELLTLQHRLLRSQMNPHFIFNALSAIQKFVIKKDAIEGASFIAKFGTLMRQFLEQSRKNYISIEDEVGTLSNYLTVQQLRFDNRFQFSITVDEEIDLTNTFIPPLLAQPFVENAIEHGFTTKDENAKIEIFFSMVNDNLLLKIVDNGKGLSGLKAKDHKSLATAITEDRLQMLRGKKNRSKIEIKDRSGIDENLTGVEVRMIVPVKD